MTDCSSRSTEAGFICRLRTALSPVPIPRTARPPDRSLRALIAFAVTEGCRVTGLVTISPMRALVVSRASRARET